MSWSAMPSTETVRRSSLDRPPQYLLCFKHDRLSRVEATVPLPADEAARIFADACGLWMKNAQATTQECAGSEGGTAFSGHFENEPDDSAQLTIQLDADEPAGPADHASLKQAKAMRADERDMLVSGARDLGVELDPDPRRNAAQARG